MSECCVDPKSGDAVPKRHRCPINGKPYAAVSPVTIKHQLRKPWNWQAKEQGYYFCRDPHCQVVYFGQDDCVIEQSALRTVVGIKEQADSALVCYCFGVTREDAAANPEIRTFVLQETRSGSCACATRNPSGRCCLADFSRG